MNDWYVHLVERCHADHDAKCDRGEHCPTRSDHIRGTFIHYALIAEVKRLQGQLFTMDHFVAVAEMVEARNNELTARLDAVRALHTEREHRPLDGTYLGGTVCDHCRRDYPCPTIAALEATK